MYYLHIICSYKYFNLKSFDSFRTFNIFFKYVILCLSDKLTEMNQTEMKKFLHVSAQSIYSLYLKWSLT